MRNHYKDAIQVQNACNLIAVLNSTIECAKDVKDWKHPALRLYAEQIMFLTGGIGDAISYSKAYDEVEKEVNKFN